MAGEDNRKRWSLFGPDPEPPAWIEVYEYINPGDRPDLRVWGESRLLDRDQIWKVTGSNITGCATLHFTRGTEHGDDGLDQREMVVWGSFEDWAERLEAERVEVGPFAAKRVEREGPPAPTQDRGF